jgi:hypothetical protein
MKMIEINDNGHVWHVPLLKVAEHRADHYADDPDSTRQEEIDFVMSDDFEGIDWFANNMNFSEVAEFAKKIVTPEVTEPDFDAEKQIIEVTQ